MNKRQRLRHERDLLAQEGIIGTKKPMGVHGLALWEGDVAHLPFGGTPDFVTHAATSPTSVAAREANKPRKVSQRERIFDLLVRVRPAGLTRPEIAQHLGLKENTVNPRVRELIDAGHAVDFGDVGRDNHAIVHPSRPTYDHGAFK